MWMRCDLIVRCLTLTTVLTGMLSGCDALVSPSYQGESRLSLSMRVENGASPTTEALVPALARADELEVRFREVEVRGEFPAAFQMHVYAAPGDDLLEPLDRWLAPESRVSTEFLAAVPKRRLDEPIDLTPDTTPLPECWDGNCDIVPGSGRQAAACAEDDRACRRMSVCEGEACGDTLNASPLPKALRDLVGFAQGFVVVFAPEALPADSWAAARLGAPEGLRAGYHLHALVDSTPEQQAEARACFEQAEAQTLERYNAEHATSFSLLALGCAFNAIPPCSQLELPSEAEAHALARALAHTQVQQGCHALAPDILQVTDPAQQTITVRIGDNLPDWEPSDSEAREAP